MGLLNVAGPARGNDRPTAVAARLARAGEETEPACSGSARWHGSAHRARKGGKRAERVAGAPDDDVAAAVTANRPVPASQ
jgi:hypothetical protein